MPDSERLVYLRILYSLIAPRIRANSTAQGVHSLFTMTVPTTSRPAGMYIPSNIFLESIGSDILATVCLSSTALNRREWK